MDADATASQRQQVGSASVYSLASCPIQLSLKGYDSQLTVWCNCDAPGLQHHETPQHVEAHLIGKGAWANVYEAVFTGIHGEAYQQKSAVVKLVWREDSESEWSRCARQSKISLPELIGGRPSEPHQL